jgi:hypothetical protein
MMQFGFFSVNRKLKYFRWFMIFNGLTFKINDFELHLIQYIKYFEIVFFLGISMYNGQYT